MGAFCDEKGAWDHLLLGSLRDRCILYAHGPDGTFTYLSPSIETILGYGEGERPESFRRLLTGHPVNEEALRIKDLAREGQGPIAFELEVWAKGGAKRRLSVDERLVLGPAGEVLGVEGCALDITSWKDGGGGEIGPESIASERLAALGKLAAGVAHEINNPINGIVNYAQLLIDALPDGADSRDLAHRILKEGERISSIVKSLLSFARERGEDKQIHDIRDIVEDVVYFSQTLLRKEGITLNFSSDEDSPRLRAQSQRIQQVLLNLINNARDSLNEKYPGGHPDKAIEIACQAVRADGAHRLRITVFDRGVGIPKDVLAKVFVPFFSTKPAGLGTGLGLSICHGIVADHGGEMRIESKDGEYARVIVELPALGGRR